MMMAQKVSIDFLSIISILPNIAASKLAILSQKYLRRISIQLLLEPTRS